MAHGDGADTRLHTLTLSTDTWAFSATLPLTTRERRLRLAFDGEVTWSSRRHRADPAIVGVLSVDLDSDPVLATAAALKSKADRLAEGISPGVVAKVRGGLRGNPFSHLISDLADKAMGVAVVVAGGDVEHVLRGSLDFDRRPEPADEPVAIRLAIS